MHGIILIIFDINLTNLQCIFSIGREKKSIATIKVRSEKMLLGHGIVSAPSG